MTPNPDQFIKSIGRVDQLLPLLNQTDTFTFFTKNRKGEFMMVNDAFVRMLGCKSREEVHGKTDHDFFSQEIANSFVKDDQYVMTKGEPLFDIKEPVLGLKMIYEWYVTNKSPLFDSSGKVIGLAGTSHKVSSGNIEDISNLKLKNCLLYIHQHYGEKVNFHELSKMTNLSQRSLERLFKKSFNMTPIKYLKMVRINEACQMLSRSEDNILNIALQCGFFDQSHMTTSFTQELQKTPREYRLSHRAKVLKIDKS